MIIMMMITTKHFCWCISLCHHLYFKCLDKTYFVARYSNQSVKSLQSQQNWFILIKKASNLILSFLTSGKYFIVWKCGFIMQCIIPNAKDNFNFNSTLLWSIPWCQVMVWWIPIMQMDLILILVKQCSFRHMFIRCNILL